MALPSAGGSQALGPAQAWERIKGTAHQVKANAERLHADSGAGDILAERVANYAGTLAGALTDLAAATAVPGLLAYAREQLDMPGFDLVAEYNAVVAEIAATRDWITTNFPQDGSGYLLLLQFAPNGTLQKRLITPAQTAGLRTQLALLIATIN